jgi:hypothetical protein
MSEAFTILFVMIGVLVITAVAFVVWIIVAIAKLLARGIAALLGVAVDVSRPPALTSTCSRQGCRALNPGSARFCRRCGLELNRRAARCCAW